MVIGFLLSAINTMTLHAKHLDEWQASAVSPTIISRNVWSIDDAREVDELLNRNTERKWKHSEELVPGWGVCGVDPRTGERIYAAFQLKPDTSPIDPKTGKPRKYFSPSSTPLAPLFLEVEDEAYWQKLITDVTSPIIITEGAKKAGAVLSQGQACISLPGVTTGGKHGRLKPELELYSRYGRSIYLAFDRDILQKAQVRQALHNLGRMVAEKGAMVYVLEWDNNFKGIDDWLASGGQIRDRLTVAKTLEEWVDAHDEGQGDTVSLDDACRLAKRYRRIEEKMMGRLRWNQLKGMVELDGKPAELEALRMYLALKHNIDIPEADCIQIVTHIAKQQSFNPVAEYLKNIALAYPPDPKLLDEMALKYLGSESPLHATYVRKTLISAVARAISPGCKVDTVCILSGLQGVGKSSFWKILAGEDNFDDSVGSVSDKDERLKLHKSWMIEWAELETVFRRKDISAVKAFITTQTDQVRPPFGRTILELARPSIIVGTTNFDNFLSDSTGNRRFWVIPISIEEMPLDELAKERDRIWAAAVHAYLSGERWELPASMRAVAAADAELFASSDSWEEPVLNYIDGLETVTVEKILSIAIRLDLGQQDKRAEMRVANVLKANGWESGRKVVHGRRLRIWLAPSYLNRGCPGSPNSTETTIEVEGQPPAQPPTQPTDQPPESVLISEPVTLAIKGKPDLTDQPPHSPCSSNHQDIGQCFSEEPLMKPGGKVRICIGQLEGQFAQIVTVDQAERMAVVKGKKWRVTQRYSLDDLAIA
jgi:predicted P-loop ATPase